MDEVTRILTQIDNGDAMATEKLLPLVYDELRALAASKLAKERPGQTLQPTALVHEAYLKLVESSDAQQWKSLGHFFVAAAEAMRRILIDTAKRKGAVKRGGNRRRLDLLDADAWIEPIDDDLLDLDAALSVLASSDREAADIVKLRLFAGLTIDEIAEINGQSPRTIKRQWAYARAWLAQKLEAEGTD